MGHLKAGVLSIFEAALFEVDLFAVHSSAV